MSNKNNEHISVPIFDTILNDLLNISQHQSQKKRLLNFNSDSNVYNLSITQRRCFNVVIEQV